jgi:phospholipid/cholesterol/gamma-HCH transport system ATP-binding protein
MCQAEVLGERGTFDSADHRRRPVRNGLVLSAELTAVEQDSVVIEASGLTKILGGRCVLDGLDLTVHHGETLVILGRSGGGKSTLLRCLLGLEHPDAGTVRIQGIDVFDADARALASLHRRMGVAFQGGALFGSMTLAQNLDLPLTEFTQLPAATRRILIRIKLGMVGLEDAMDRFPSELSGGMRKRAALARALVLDPHILFFDEPSAGLDPVTAAGLDQLLLRLKRVTGVTVVVVTHDLASAYAIADRLALLDEGRFIATGSLEAVRQSQDPRVRRFLDRAPPEELEGGSLYHRLIAPAGQERLG